jgi:hypothetical protein
VVLELAFGEAQTGALVDAVATGNGTLGHVKVSLAPQVPVVAVGGPVKIYYPELGKRLGCDVIFTPHCDVANAIGAAAGLVAARASAQVDGDGSGLFRVSGQGAVLTLTSGAQALAKATELAEAAALAQAQAQGTSHARVKLHVEKHYMPEAQNDDGLLTALVTAEARGVPHL